jgi:FMN-dependent NADH-azoreductase
MKTLLNIRTSLHGADGQSSRLADEFIDGWQARTRGGRVVVRDLAETPVPHLTADAFSALTGNATDLTAEQRDAIALSDALIDEIKMADVIVFGVPMYNFSVPSTLRAYFDHIARAGVTFRYTADGPVALIERKPVYVFVTRGGVYGDEADSQTPYLRQFLSFIGLDDVRFVHAEGLAIDATTRENSLDTARRAISDLVRVVEAPRVTSPDRPLLQSGLR